MQAAVEKGEEAQHAAEADQFGQVKDLAQRSDGEGDHQKSQGPVSGAVRECTASGSGIVSAADECRQIDGCERAETHDKQSGYAPFAGEDFAGERSRHAGIPGLVVLAQVHAGVEAGDLVAVAVEHQGLVRS